MIPQCRDLGVGVVPWSPLARGVLARPPATDAAATERAASDEFTERLYGDDDVPVIEAVAEVAGRRGIPMAQVALAWLLGRPGVTAPIVGATKLSHLEDAVAAVDLALTVEDVAQLEAPYVPHPVLGHG